jgi:hypothetical protein
MIYHSPRSTTAPVYRSLFRPAASILAVLASAVLQAPAAHAADPYDASLEARVEALEKELNIMEGDSKGKNVETENVPTFLSAAGANVQQLTISGDLRFRYNYQNENFQYPTAGNDQQTSRYLFRLRLNLNYTLNDNFFVGLGVTTNGAADSGNQDITEGFDDYGIYLHQFMLGYKATDFLTVQIGKIFAPFYNNSDTLLNWSNVNPTGLTEKLTFPIGNKLNVAGNFGQYIFYDNPESNFAATSVTLADGVKETVYSTNPSNTQPQDQAEDAILLYQDAIVTYKPTDLVTVILSPAFYFFAQHGSVGLSGNAVGPSGRSSPNSVNTANPLSPTQGALLGTADFNSNDASRSLYVAFFDGDVQFPVGPIKGKFFWDFAYNFEGGQRDNQILGLAENSFHDKDAWIAGFQLGEPKRKGDWYVSAEYAQVGVGSIDPNLNDTNFGLSRLNVQGYRLALGYNIETWMRAEVWYYGAWNLDKNLHTTNGDRLTSSTVRSFYDENSSQNLIVQLITSF